MAWDLIQVHSLARLAEEDPVGALQRSSSQVKPAVDLRFSWVGTRKKAGRYMDP